ncbi:hypothetical protein [Embleya scabrispora]|uniref:hypothetical protein n=1 Tax=Embleya scabrispora TaxID=159449 RepID=UPI00131A2C1B|nr:hypothetical protein [Embleya scabrispora]MYS86228.1 hypothetical protein [Streptomyces sp. SID5474]
MSVKIVVAALLAVTGCGDDGKSSSPTASASPSVGCDPPALAQDEWLRSCGPGSGRDTGPANTAPVGGWVALPNGIVVSVARVEPAPVVESAGPGSFPALVTLTVTNRSQTPYDVSGVRISEMGRVGGPSAERITHGSLPQQDFTGTVAPGRTVVAQQLFDVPDALRPGFRVIVAMTPIPSALPDATFTGRLPQGTGSAPASPPSSGATP